MPFKFGVDSSGNYGYIKAGADTVTPFLTRTGNATSPHVLSGYTFSNASSSGLTGTMPNLSVNSTITHASDNQTKVILADAAFISTNSDGNTRLELRYVGTGGYITSNTLFALDVSTVGQTTLPGTASPGDITAGKTAWVNGIKITGTRPAPSSLQSGQFSFSSASYEQITRTVYFNPEFDSVPKVTYTLSGGRMSMVSVTPYRTHVIFVMLHSHGNDHHTGTVVWSATV